MKRLALTGLLPGKNYSVQVRSRTDAGTSTWSQSLDFSTVLDTTPPDVPSNVAWVVSGTSFVATWDAVDPDDVNNLDLDHYAIEITDGVQTVLYRVQNTRFDFTFEMNRAAFGTPKPTLTFSVRAVDASANESAASAPITVSNPVPLPVVVTTTPGVESIQLSWPPTADTDIKGYNVYMSQVDDFVPGPSNRLFIETTSWTLTTSSTAPWYFHVRAVDVFGQESTSTEVNATATSATGAIDLTPPAPPTAVNVSAGFDAPTQQAYFDVTWTNSVSTDVRDYIIRYTTDGSHYNYQTATASGHRIFVPAGATYTVGAAARDFTGNVSTYADAGATAAANDTTAPSTPAAPTASGNTMQMQVTHNNKKADGVTNIESDVAYYNVYASKTTGFTANAGNYFGKITKSTTTSEVFPLPVTTASGTAAEVWYVKVKAVDRAGNESASSAEGTVTPNLISNANIVDATITSAKIVTLAADKLTAGLGIITDLIVGNGTVNSGSIKTADYVAGTTGWKIGYDATQPSGSRTVLEINQGLIKASALELKNSFNVMPWAYSTFEYKASFFNSLSKTNATAVISTASPVPAVGQLQSLVIGTTNASNRVYLGVSATDYNVRTEGGKPYIVSYWAKGGVGGEIVTPRLTSSTGTTYDGTPVTLTTSWVRYSTVLTPAASGSILSFSASTSGAAYAIDAIQVEEKIGSLSTPTSYNPPSMTSIDAGVITTGSIQSTSTVVVGSVTVPAWYIDMAGGAQFSDARVIGSITVGGNNIAGAGSDTANSVIKSSNYTNAVGVEAGWQIDGAGNAVLNSAIIRGTLQTALIKGNLTMDTGIIRTSGLNIPRIELDSSELRSFGRKGAVIDTFPLLQTGNVLVEQHSNYASSNLIHVFTSGQTVSNAYYLDGTYYGSGVNHGFTSVYAVGEDGSGQKYVFNGFTSVKKFAQPDSTNFYSTVLNTFTVPSGANDMCVDDAGNFYLMYEDNPTTTIRKYNTSGVLQGTYVLNIVGLNITVDNFNNHLVIHGLPVPTLSTKLFRYTTSGVLVASQSIVNQSYQDIAVDNTNGNVFLITSSLSGSSLGRILRYTSAGVLIDGTDWGDNSLSGLSNYGYSTMYSCGFDYNSLDDNGLPNFIFVSNFSNALLSRVTQSVETSTVISTSDGYIRGKQAEFSVKLLTDNLYVSNIVANETQKVNIYGAGSWKKVIQSSGLQTSTIFSGNVFEDLPITFDEPFDSVPAVFCQYSGTSPNNYEITPISVTTTGFTMRFKRFQGSTTTSNATINGYWFATTA